MHRFFLQTPVGEDGIAQLFGDDARHIQRVLRLQPGDAIALLDGKGNICDASILRVDTQGMAAQIGAWSPCLAEPQLDVTVYQALPKGEKLSFVLQKGTELGTKNFVLMQTEHCVRQATQDKQQKLLQRSQRIVYEAAKQSRRGIVPQVRGPLPLAQVAAEHGQDALLVAYEGEATALRQALDTLPQVRKIGICIGPEGGFAAQEIQQFRSHGAQLVTLGRRILRTETAPIALLSALMYHYGEMEV